MNLDCPIGIKLKRANAVGDRIFIEGNAAAALGAVYGGATVCAWYPITPVHLAGRGVHAPLPEAARRSRNQEEQFRHRAGRGRIRLDRHGDRRRLERRALLHRDLGPRHLADAGVPRPRLFRRNPGRGVRRPARRPLDRHADAHAAVRHHPPAPMPRTATPSMCCCFPENPAETLRVRRRGVRSRRPAADADLRHAGSRHRHERPPVPAAHLGRHARFTTAARS